MNKNKLNWNIDTLLENDMIYIVFKSNNPQAKELFPQSLKVSGNKFSFKEKYSDFKKQDILKSVEEVKNDINNFFLEVQSQIKEYLTEDKNLEIYFKELFGNDYKYEYTKPKWISKYGTTENNMFINYLRFVGTDTERLGFPHGLSINQEIFEETQRENFAAYQEKVELFFDLTFTH